MSFIHCLLTLSNTIMKHKNGSHYAPSPSKCRLILVVTVAQAIVSLFPQLLQSQSPTVALLGSQSLPVPLLGSQSPTSTSPGISVPLLLGSHSPFQYLSWHLLPTSTSPGISFQPVPLLGSHSQLVPLQGSQSHQYLSWGLSSNQYLSWDLSPKPVPLL